MFLYSAMCKMSCSDTTETGHLSFTAFQMGKFGRQIFLLFGISVTQQHDVWGHTVSLQEALYRGWLASPTPVGRHVISRCSSLCSLHQLVSSACVV